MRRALIVALRTYVAMFAVGLLVPVAILLIGAPRIVACSDGPCRGTAEMLASAVLVLLVAASALVAAIGVQARGARWLAAGVLSIGVLRYGYFMLPLARAPMADVLLMIVTTAPFMLGPLCVALWLCRLQGETVPTAHTSLSGGDGLTSGFTLTLGRGFEMKVTRLGWMGGKTRQFDRMNAFYRDVLSLEVLSIDDESGRFKLDDGTEIHVYGPQDPDHAFFGSGPVVAFEVDDFAAARARLLNVGTEFIYEEPRRALGRIWQHFIAPDGNVYEIIGNDVAT